jgi:hypothetical protein
MLYHGRGPVGAYGHLNYTHMSFPLPRIESVGDLVRSHMEISSATL